MASSKLTQLIHHRLTEVLFVLRAVGVTPVPGCGPPYAVLVDQIFVRAGRAQQAGLGVSGWGPSLEFVLLATECDAVGGLKHVHRGSPNPRRALSGRRERMVFPSVPSISVVDIVPVWGEGAAGVLSHLGLFGVHVFLAQLLLVDGGGLLVPPHRSGLVPPFEHSGPVPMPVIQIESLLGIVSS
eukprot:CAMPEP_0198198460 /NCGR_PEP_ID=MMETSP1445-20131203/1924_1 /TAXON_ID=36898 /ORGANISM="Pyramimonas sp., Strain CCMP2087" /LENGTH=183 /DNA_ID=CAMNT_0043868031 /DNA_START=518 /DNA_END=1069 /DNA_ORIENTATION=+